MVGYFPNNDNGRGTAYYQNFDPPPGVTSYKLRVRHGNGAQFFVNIYPASGLPLESNSANFNLPLDDLGIPTSWETGIQVIVDARQGNFNLQTKTMTNINHPSTDLVDLGFTPIIVPADPPGDYDASFTDDRPTAQASHYSYDFMRKTFGPVTITQVKQATHGIVGSFPITKDHASTTRALRLPVLAGQQMFWIRPRVTYKNSFGSNLGRYDIGRKSPNVYVETTP